MTTYTATQCNHDTQIVAPYSFYAKGVLFRKNIELIIKEGASSPEYCHACFIRRTTPCAECDHPIFPGERIGTLLKADLSDVPKSSRDYATIEDGGETKYVVCKDCAHEDDLHGYWIIGDAKDSEEGRPQRAFVRMST